MKYRFKKNLLQINTEHIVARIRVYPKVSYNATLFNITATPVRLVIVMRYDY